MDVDALTALWQKTSLSGKELAEFIFEISQEQERAERVYKRDLIRDEEERV